MGRDFDGFKSLDLEEGERVLIRGGTTSVGLAAAALAKLHGATVAATTRRPDRALLLRSSGVDQVFIDNGIIAEQVKLEELVEKITAGQTVKAGPLAPTDSKASPGAAPLDARTEANKIAFDRVGHGEKVLLISGFPQTRRSWNRLVPLLSAKFETIPADLPSFGDSGLLSAPASTENVARVFHEFVASLGLPLHVVAHDFGAWCAYSWALLFPGDFKSLTLIEAGIPGVTLLNDIQLSDYKRKWNFIFMMVPDLPAALTRGREDVYVGWWYKNKVYEPGVIPPNDVAAYVRAFAREGRMDAAFDYCRNIVVDMEFNKKQFAGKLPVRLLAVGGQYSIPTMGEALRPYFQSVKSVVIPDSGHFVPEEQPEALAKALLAFL